MEFVDGKLTLNGYYVMMKNEVRENRIFWERVKRGLEIFLKL